tara:strand:+ start:485 stop:760 length:276 start_codon:yes stop_codon:yes gene_type:complete
MTVHSGTYIPSDTADTMNTQSTRLKQTSVTQLAINMFSSATHGTGSIVNHDWTDLKFNQPTGIEGGNDARIKKGIERPVYGQQYPRGYYNK